MIDTVWKGQHMAIKQTKTRCKTRTKAGKPCRAAATDSGLCFFHANPNKAVELGRIGGRKNAHTRSEAATALPALETAGAIREMVARLVDDLYSGKLQPRVASALVPLLSLQHRVLETSNFERRLAELEQLLAERAEAPAVPGPDEDSGKNGEAQPS
jgi:hypothetical protein